MTDQNHDEIDLGVIFNRIKRVYHSVLVGIYNALQFLRRKWIILLAIIVVGYGLGYVWTKAVDYPKEAFVVLQTNFESANYVYDAINLLQIKQKQNDGIFLRKYGFDGVTAEIDELEISPIVNLFDLLEKPETSDRNLEEFLDQSDFQEDLLLSEVFIPEYKYHRLLVTLTHEGSQETIDKIIAYLNSNPFYQEVREVTVAEIEDQIEQNKVSIEKIDAVYDVHGGKVVTDTPNPSQFYFRHQENNNLHQVMDKKNELLLFNEELKNKLVLYKDVVVVVNDPQVNFKYGPFANKRLYLPLTVLILYIGWFVGRSFYRSIEEVYQSRSEA